MDIKLRKQPEKYLKKADSATYGKLMCAINGLRDLEGDIIKLKGSDKYRLKIYHYRIIFVYDNVNNNIIVEKIGSRGDVY